MSGYILNTQGRQSSNAVLCKELIYRYSEAELNALDRVTLSVAHGEVISLLGHNGAGKSTLLKILAGSIKPASGVVEVLGSVPGKQPNRVTHLVQRSSLSWNFPINLAELVETGTYVRRGWFRGISKQDKALVCDTIQTLGLEDFARRPIAALSGGQQQRALLARALVHDAELYLLDEPFTAVDEATCEILLQQFLKLKNQGRTLIISTHDCDVLQSLQPRKILLRDGKITIPQ